jgi:hypothetical protein
MTSWREEERKFDDVGNVEECRRKLRGNEEEV